MRAIVFTVLACLPPILAACAGAPQPPSSASLPVAYHAKSGDVDPSGDYRMQLTSAGGRREADLSIWLKPDGSGYAGIIMFDGQTDPDSLSVRVDGNRVRMELRLYDRWLRRNVASRGNTASELNVPTTPSNLPVVDLRFDGVEIRGTRLWRAAPWGPLEETIVGRKSPARTGHDLSSSRNQYL